MEIIHRDGLRWQVAYKGKTGWIEPSGITQLEKYQAQLQADKSPPTASVPLQSTTFRKSMARSSKPVNSPDLIGEIDIVVASTSTNSKGLTSSRSLSDIHRGIFYDFKIEKKKFLFF